MKLTKYISVFSAVLLMAVPVISYSEQSIDSSKEVKIENRSPGFSQIAKKAMPATVFIKATIAPQLLTQNEFQSPFDPFGDDFFRRFFNFPNGHGMPQMPQQQQIAGGSGFFISSDGFIVTNYHVVKDAKEITIVLNDGREFPATVNGSDPKTDLAVLKINETNLPFLTFGDSDGLEIGEWVIAIGSPFALESSLTVGVVSAKGRQDLGVASLEDFIQTDAVINPGNSGGPLLNLDGQVIGVNTAIMSRTGGYMGIGFSIPSHMAERVIDQIMNSGGVKRAYLGVVLQQIDKELADALGLEKQDGVLISEILKDSPANKGGLQQGDIILQYNDKPVKSVSNLRKEISMMKPDEIIKLKVQRNDQTIDLNVSLGVQSTSEIAYTEMIQKIGIEVDNASPELASRLNFPSDALGIVITKVLPGSPAQLAGLKPGFIITGVAMHGNEPKSIHNTSEFDAVLQEVNNRKHIILIVRHQNFQRYYTVKLG